MFLIEGNHDDPAFEETLGGRIVHAREAQDLTTSQLARRLGVKSSTLHGWENDRSEPRPNRLLTLAGILNVSPTWLLTGGGESPAKTMSETEMMHISGTVARLRDRALKLVDELEQLRERLDTYQRFDN